jgi:inward rectifier potassium channel
MIAHQVLKSTYGIELADFSSLFLENSTTVIVMNESEKQQFRMVLKNGALNIKQKQGQVNLRDLYHDFLNLSWPKFTAVFAILFFLINAVFGFVYSLIPFEQFEGLKHETGVDRYLESFFFSVQTLGTIGYGHVSPVGFIANSVVTLECYTGIFVVALMTGLIFARFARPHVKVVFSDSAVIRKFNDLPCLMFRVANERQNHITDARIRVFLVMDDPSTGYRDFTELKLERDYSPLFALSWTIAHDIDSDSPLSGLDRDQLIRFSAELIVTFSGTDTTLSHEMFAKTSYTPDEIRLDHDFVDVIKRHPDHSVSLAMEYFHQTRPLP